MQPSTVKLAHELLGQLNESGNRDDVFAAAVESITLARTLANRVIADWERPDHEFEPDAALMDHLSNCPVCAEETCEHIEAMRRNEEPPTPTGLAPAMHPVPREIAVDLTQEAAGPLAVREGLQAPVGGEPASVLLDLDEPQADADADAEVAARDNDADDVHSDAIDDMSWPAYKVMEAGADPMAVMGPTDFSPDGQQ